MPSSTSSSAAAKNSRGSRTPLGASTSARQDKTKSAPAAGADTFEPGSAAHASSHLLAVDSAPPASLAPSETSAVVAAKHSFLHIVPQRYNDVGDWPSLAADRGVLIKQLQKEANSEDLSPHALHLAERHLSERSPRASDRAAALTALSSAANRNSNGMGSMMARALDFNRPLERALFDRLDEAQTHETYAGLADAHQRGQVIGFCLKRGVRASEATTSEGKTALHCAAQNAWPSFAKNLLEHQLSLRYSTDSLGRIPLHLACAHNNSEMARILIDAQTSARKAKGPSLRQWWDGSDINRPDKAEQTPLHLAARAGAEDCLHSLLHRRGIKVNRRDAAGNTPLLLAAAHHHLGSVAILLGLGRADVNPQGDGGGALQLGFEDPRIIAELLGHQADPSLVHPHSQRTALWGLPVAQAASAAQRDSLGLLLAAGANPWHADAQGQRVSDRCLTDARLEELKMMCTHSPPDRLDLAVQVELIGQAAALMAADSQATKGLALHHLLNVCLEEAIKDALVGLVDHARQEGVAKAVLTALAKRKVEASRWSEEAQLSLKDLLSCLPERKAARPQPQPQEAAEASPTQA